MKAPRLSRLLGDDDAGAATERGGVNTALNSCSCRPDGRLAVLELSVDLSADPGESECKPAVPARKKV